VSAKLATANTGKPINPINMECNTLISG